MLVDSLPPGEGGFHLTKNNQPYAKIVARPGAPDWTIDASHEIIEMLVDPAGSRFQTSNAIGVDGDKIIEGSGQFEYLVEACDPCEADAYGYQIGGVVVSDFITPRFYEPIAVPGSRYSFTGAITSPRQILRGGYISWVNPETDAMQQLLYLSDAPEIRDLGSANGVALRSYVDGLTRRFVETHHDNDRKSNEHWNRRTKRINHSKALQLAAVARATRYM
jgi:hypothetical protein